MIYADPNAPKIEFPTYVPPVQPTENGTPTHSKKSPFNKKTAQLILACMLLLIVVIGGGASYFLAQTNQDVRNQASEIKTDEQITSTETKPQEPEVKTEPPPVETKPPESTPTETKPPETTPQPDTTRISPSPNQPNTSPDTSIFSNFSSTFYRTSNNISGQVAFDYTGEALPTGTRWTLQLSTNANFESPSTLYTQDNTYNPTSVRQNISGINLRFNPHPGCGATLFWRLTNTEAKPLSTIQRATLVCQTPIPTVIPTYDQAFYDVTYQLYRNQAQFSFKIDKNKIPAKLLSELKTLGIIILYQNKNDPNDKGQFIRPNGNPKLVRDIGFATATYNANTDSYSLVTNNPTEWAKYTCENNYHYGFRILGFKSDGMRVEDEEGYAISSSMLPANYPTNSTTELRINCNQSNSGSSSTSTTGSDTTSSGSNSTNTSGTSGTTGSTTGSTTTSGSTGESNKGGSQPTLPEELPQTGADWTTWTKIGLGALGLGIVFLLFL